MSDRPARARTINPEILRGAKPFDFKTNWRKVSKAFRSDEYRHRVLVDLDKYAEARGWDLMKRRELPCDFDSCSWRCSHPDANRVFCKYVCHGACHWLANANLVAAKIAFPDKPWRIVSSEDLDADDDDEHDRSHSTVWDGDKTFFDPNMFALFPDEDMADRFHGLCVFETDHVEV